MSDLQLDKVKKLVISVFALFLVVFGLVILTVIRSVRIEDYCMRYSREKLGDRWYDKIGPDITKEEYAKQTGYDTFFNGDYSEASLGWFEVFKCENQHGNVVDFLTPVLQPILNSVLSNLGSL